MVLRKTPLMVLCFLMIGFASCNKAGIAPGPGKGVGKDLALTAVEQQQIPTDNAFTLKLFKNLDSANTSGANLFVSPLSVGFAMGMTSNGASGQTLTAINSGMGFNGFTQAQVNSYYHDLLTNLPQLDPNTTVNIANSIWYNKNLTVLPQFLQVNTSNYNARIQSLDFSNSASLNTVNNWVNTQTNGAIPSIISEIQPGDQMYLVNAIYFKSIWNEKFDPSKTSQLPFYLADNSTVQANFVDGTVDYKRYTDNKTTVVELPYANNRYSMIIIMPASGTTVQELAAGIDPATWQNWMTSLASVKGELKLPKFQFSYSTNLNNALTDLGMGIAFSDDADFSLISNTMALHISRVVHKAYVNVDENGTTAAAATAVVIGDTADAPTPPEVINHPFIFAIRQVSSGLIMFAGTMNNPSFAGE